MNHGNVLGKGFPPKLQELNGSPGIPGEFSGNMQRRFHICTKISLAPCCFICCFLPESHRGRWYWEWFYHSVYLFIRSIWWYQPSPMFPILWTSVLPPTTWEAPIFFCFHGNSRPMGRHLQKYRTKYDLARSHQCYSENTQCFWGPFWP